MDIGSGVKSMWEAITDKVRQSDTFGFFLFVTFMTIILLFATGILIDCNHRSRKASEVVPEQCVESVEYVWGIAGNYKCAPGATMIHEEGIPGVKNERVICRCPQETFDEEGDVEHLPFKM